MALASIAVEAFAQPAHELFLHPVEPFVVLADHQDVIGAPTLALDSVQVGGGRLQVAQGAAVAVLGHLHVTRPPAPSREPGTTTQWRRPRCHPRGRGTGHEQMPPFRPGVLYLYPCRVRKRAIKGKWCSIR